MRKLASIQRVLALDPIANADFIETAQINGWQCIVRKGEFKVGDLGVYFEIDAVPPATPVFEFLWAPKLAPAPNFRIRTKKLRGVVSQGLLMPLTEFSEMGPDIFVEGQDVTEQLGVKKYELPVKLPGQRASERPYGAFASDVPKTDEDRLQSNMGLLDELRGLPYEIREKCDGSSVTFSIDREGKFRVYSRNWEVRDGKDATKFDLFVSKILHRMSRMLFWWPRVSRRVLHAARERMQTFRSAYWDVARLHSVESALRAGNQNLALQGEVCGPSIQKNRLGLSRYELRAFNLYDKTKGDYCSPAVLENFLAMYGIPQCKLIERGESFHYSLPSLLHMAEGKYDGTLNEREGLVIRPQTPVFSKVLCSRLSFKVISNRYLLKGGEDD